MRQRLHSNATRSAAERFTCGIFRAALLCALLLAAGGKGLMAQTSQPKVRGVVLDEKKQPLVGATVLVKGTNRGATTNTDGKFSIAAKPNQTLVISMLGFVPQEIPVGKQTQLRVTLKEDTQMIENVVVEIGYGSQRLADLTGTVSRVKMDGIIKAPVASFDQALQGRLAGVQVSSTDGQPGAEMEIKSEAKRS